MGLFHSSLGDYRMLVNTDCLCVITYRQNTVTVSIMSLYLASWIALLFY